ncbi:MAG: hypothetical protein LBF33_02435 [Oscillospiraceae bacterium]|nr:hypothetical protein [Oscillospiraceae bacterium]
MDGWKGGIEKFGIFQEIALEAIKFVQTRKDKLGRWTNEYFLLSFVRGSS